ncbi:MAG: UbiA family prenyltransferase [Phycisphaerales bacterium]|nr:UbiA family prenyltransferase [Phycisphaerales bacterium]
MSATRDWYVTLRAANVPTVWADVLLGAGLAAGSAAIEWPLAVVLAGISCLYLGGMAFNDAVDVAFDRRNQSTRPVASGRVSAKAAMTAASALLLAGFACIAVAEFGPDASSWTMDAGVLLVALISLYQWTHRKSPVLAAFFMAACRTAVPVIAALAVVGHVSIVVWIAAAAVGIWTAGITMSGRGERGGERAASSGVEWFLIAAMAPIPMAVLRAGGDLGGMAAGILILLLAWIPAVHRRYAAGHQGHAVRWAIAGLAVLDSAMLLAGGLPAFSAAAMVCAAMTLVGQQLGGGGS